MTRTITLFNWSCTAGGNGPTVPLGLHLARRLQSVMNAAARLVLASSKCDHISPLLRQLHWLKVPWRIDYKLAVYKCLHGLAPSYSLTYFIIQQSLSFEGVCVSASSHELSVPRTRLSTYGDRAFPVAAVRIYTVSQKNCAFLFLSELRQISTNFNKFR